MRSCATVPAAAARSHPSRRVGTAECGAGIIAERMNVRRAGVAAAAMEPLTTPANKVAKATAAIVVTAGLAVAACGGKSNDTVDNSEITELNAAGMMEGTTNDASAMDVATDTNVAAAPDNAADNASVEAENATGNTSESNSQ